MGKSYRPKYVIRDGKGAILYAGNSRPNLETEVQKYIESLKIGGVNDHISKALGYIPIPQTATLYLQSGKRNVDVLEKWIAPAFMAF